MDAAREEEGEFDEAAPSLCFLPTWTLIPWVEVATNGHQGHRRLGAALVPGPAAVLEGALGELIAKRAEDQSTGR